MKKKFFFDRKEKKLQMDSEENSFERCVLCGVVTDVPCELPVFFRLNRESLYLCFKIILFFRLFSI